MGIDTDALKQKAMQELEPKLLPTRRFIDSVKEAIAGGIDTVGIDTIADWMFVIPTMYGELRCLEAECLASADLIGNQIDFVKQDSISGKVGGTITEARAKAAVLTNDLQVQQSVAKFMARYVAGLWNQLEMTIFSVRDLWESKKQRFPNDVQ